jgi:hypothetical protein
MYICIGTWRAHTASARSLAQTHHCIAWLTGRRLPDSLMDCLITHASESSPPQPSSIILFWSRCAAGQLLLWLALERKMWLWGPTRTHTAATSLPLHNSVVNEHRSIVCCVFASSFIYMCIYMYIERFTDIYIHCTYVIYRSNTYTIIIPLAIPWFFHCHRLKVDANSLKHLITKTNMWVYARAIIIYTRVCV